MSGNSTNDNSPLSFSRKTRSGLSLLGAQFVCVNTTSTFKQYQHTTRGVYPPTTKALFPQLPPFLFLPHSPSPLPPSPSSSLPSPPFPFCRKAAPLNQLEGLGSAVSSSVGSGTSLTCNSVKYIGATHLR